MAESFESLDNVLRDWAKDKIKKKCLFEALNKDEKQQEEKKKDVCFLESELEKNNRALSVGSRVIKVGLQINFKEINH